MTWGASPWGTTPWGASPSVGGTIMLSADDGFVLADADAYVMLPYAYDHFGLSTTPATLLHAFNAVVDRVALRDATLIAWSLFATSTTALTTTSAYTYTLILAAM